MISAHLFIACLCAATLCRGDNIIKIQSAHEFIDFSKKATQKKGYNGTTVLLEADIDFSGGLSEQFVPIGTSDTSLPFYGVFDGQGHTIKNLIINMSMPFVGLFGTVEDGAIRNVVMDSSCAIFNNYEDEKTSSVGGIVGNSYYAIIENCVNMANIYLTANTTEQVIAGGIIGYAGGDILKNCANYGKVTVQFNYASARVGGIVGLAVGSDDKEYWIIQNCINYGAVNVTMKYSGIIKAGGIAGKTMIILLGNCVSANTEITATESNETFVGIVAGVSWNTVMTYCYWDNASQYDDIMRESRTIKAECFSYNSSSFELNGEVSVNTRYKGSSLIKALNAYAESHNFYDDCPKWLLNKEEKEILFTVNRMTHLELNSQLVLLPSLATEGTTVFKGWYTDASCTKPLDSYEVSENTTLYGQWAEDRNNYTITFDTRGGSPVAPIQAHLDDTVMLETKEYNFLHWENEYGDEVGPMFTMPAHNVTLYAVWRYVSIYNATDFIKFAREINSGMMSGIYSVVLENDIDFSETTEEFVPINTDYMDSFSYIFNGQGHAINNLVINTSSLQYVGLFGYSTITVMNIVIDSTCSITSYYNKPDSDAFVGSIIGYCNNKYQQENCRALNSINMADVTFRGTSRNLYIGGLIGKTLNSNYVQITNMANYGAVTFAGLCDTASIGGIVGHVSGLYKYDAKVCNNINYGAVTNHGTASKGTRIGGITGYSSHTSVENCVVASGSVKLSGDKNVAGMIIGYMDNSEMYNSYWDKAIASSSMKAYGDGSDYIEKYAVAFDSTTFKLSKPVVAGKYKGDSLLNALNAMNADALSYKPSKWALNRGSKTITFMASGRIKPILITKQQVILFPNPYTYYGTWFYEWFTDPEYENPLKSYEFTEDTTLYGKKTEYTFKSNMPGWAIALIVIAVVIVVAAAVVVIVLIMKKKKQHDYNTISDRETESLIQ